MRRGTPQQGAQDAHAPKTPVQHVAQHGRAFDKREFLEDEPAVGAAGKWRRRIGIKGKAQN